jgi:glycosyltransferase involved in cell wall biosynthesis
MRFHVIGLPHVDLTAEQSWCAYSNKLRRLSTGLTKAGHQVILYGPAETTAVVDEFVPCYPHPTNDPEQVPPFDSEHRIHRLFNARVMGEMATRIEPRDFILTVAGGVQKPIADFFPQNMTVEAGIGYSGTFSPYRVFESYAWMHMVYGTQHHGSIMNCPANSMCDAVIPNLFDPEDFPLGEGDGGYYLFCGRLIDMKGWHLAVEVTERIGAKLILAGQGDPGELPPHVEHVGLVGPQRRAELMAGATATFVPTQYCEPFGGVHVESMMSGTPVITTDWGVFTETVTPTVGFRCRTFAEFCQAAVDAYDLTREAIRRYAIGRFSTDVVVAAYLRYFERLTTLWGDGFYEMEAP